ncbi:DUF6714 family protein [Lysobacter sp. CCNWLW3]|uniref:DUF6714 family protein n=1 Tax=unclassified Lysobacter TaxID=2635362 RepID=UPI002FD1A543
MDFTGQEARKIIESAFDGVPRPEISLQQLVLTDQKGMSGTITDEEWRLAGTTRTDAKWQDISALEIERCGCQLAHMQADEFRYYLPAYMVYSLGHAQGSFLESDICASVVFGLAPSKDHPSYSIGQYSLLDLPKRRAVTAFLACMANSADGYDRAGAKRALAFWGRGAE